MQGGFLLCAVAVGQGEDDGVGEMGFGHLVGHGAHLSGAVLVLGEADHHHFGMVAQTGEILFGGGAVLQDEELQRCVGGGEEGHGGGGVDGVGAGLALPGVEVDDVAAAGYALLGQGGSGVEVVGGGVGVVVCVGAGGKGGDDGGHVVAADAEHGLCLAAHGCAPGVVGCGGGGDDAVSLACGDMADELACDGYLGFGLFAEAHAYGVADAVGEECADAQCALDASVLALSGLGDAEVQG